MTDPSKERRFRIINIKAQEILTLFNWFRGPQFIALPNLSGMFPQECEVVRVFYDDRRDCFGIVVAHETFEIVDPGLEIPIMVYPTIVVERVESEYTYRGTQTPVCEELKS